MKLRFKKGSSKNKKTVMLGNKVDMPKDFYGDIEYTSLNFIYKMFM